MRFGDLRRLVGEALVRHPGRALTSREWAEMIEEAHPAAGERGRR